MPGFVYDVGTFQESWDLAGEYPGMLARCMAVTILNSTYCEIQPLGMFNVRNIGQMSFVGCTNDWQNRHSGRTLILSTPLPHGHVHLTGD